MIFGHGNSTLIEVILPNSTYNCNKIRIEVYEFIDGGDENLITILRNFTTPPDFPLACRRSLGDILTSKSPYWNSTVSVFQNTVGVDATAFSIQF